MAPRAAERPSTLKYNKTVNYEMLQSHLGSPRSCTQDFLAGTGWLTKREDGYRREGSRADS
jgi:hypothetical protein